MKRLASAVELLAGVVIVGVLTVILFVTFGGAPATIQLSPGAATAYPVVEPSPAKPYPSPLESAPTSESSYPPFTATPIARPSLPVCDFTERAPDTAGIASSVIDRFGPSQAVQAPVSGIAGWLDAQQLLVSREPPASAQMSFYALNLFTGDMHLYVAQSALTQPVWLASARAIAYAVSVPQGTDSAGVIRNRTDLYVTFIDSAQTLVVASDILATERTFAAEPDGQRLWYFLRTDPLQPYIYDAHLNASQPASFHLSSFISSKPDLEWAIRSEAPLFKLAWHPDGVKLLIYSQYWTFLLNTQTGQACEVELIDSEDYKAEAMLVPPWPFMAQWSPDGNYVAIISTTDFQLPYHHTDLIVLNIVARERYTLSLGDAVPPYYRQSVTDLAWSPDSRYVTALAFVNHTGDRPATGLFVVEAATGASARILPSDVFGLGSWGARLAWNPTGEWLAAMGWDGLSLIPVYP
ncbi:hypothetical protein A6A03_08400 [Chloroflexus islandicus]|uniref:Uncharacterized protein n=1 Tax=Chloroflexus islandicus TaxID=1707952 RepID=A0A178MIC7_9CHLR|nr:hypothetical protein [Chloroflexus islandicus]OAN48390.1 hypothetical protein A6A03_08400 [Chloroflexus islandicus]